MQYTTEDLLALDDESFKKVVDDDLRSEGKASSGFAPALRTKEVVNRWIAQLTQSQISIDNQMASRDAEFEANQARDMRRIELEDDEATRIKLTAELLERKEKYHRSRFGRLRVQGGLAATLVQARYLRERLYPGPHGLIEELHNQSTRCRELEAAISTHRSETLREGIEQSEMDDELWSHLPIEVIE